MLPQALAWTNPDAITTVTRQSSVAITWTGGSADGYVDITGRGIIDASALAQSTVSFTCRANASDQSFAVPPYVLLSLPAGSGSLLIGSTTRLQRFTATGLDLGIANSSVGIFKSVTFQDSLIKNPFGNHAVHSLGAVH